MPQYGIQAMGMLSVHNHSNLTQGGAVPVGSLVGHNTPIHDALDIDADTVDGIDIPSIIANILTNHTKAVHDALLINADAVDTYHHNQSLLNSDSPSFVNINVTEGIVHGGDVDTYLWFRPDRTTLTAGGFNFIDMEGTKLTLSAGASGVVCEGKFSLGAPTELTIAGGAITVTRGYHRIDGAGDADDNLDTINGGVDGMILVLQSEHTDREITITQAGNIDLNVAGNFILTTTHDKILLIYNALTTYWEEISRSDNLV